MATRILPLIAASSLFISGAAAACPISQTKNVVNDPHTQFELAAYVVLATVVTAMKTEDGLAERVELDIHRVLKGLPDGVSKVTNYLGSDCSQWLDVGQQYLIFARRLNDQVNDQHILIGLTGEDAQAVLRDLSGVSK